MIDKTVK